MARKKTTPFMTKFLVLFFILALTLSVISFAYATYSYGYNQRIVPVKTVYAASTYTQPINTAVYHWNVNMPSSGTQMRVTELVPTSHDSTNYIYTLYLADEWYGVYEPLSVNIFASNNKTSKFKITLNHTLLEDESFFFKVSVIAHELGHAYGLDHTDYSGNLMDTQRDRELVYAPKTDDINGAKYMASLLP